VLITCLTCKTSAQGNAPFKVPQYWKNTNMLRTIDLTSPVVRIATSVVAQNIHNESIGEYYYPIPEEWNKHLSYIEVKERKTEQVFEVEKAEFESLKWVPSSNNISQFEDMYVMQFSSETNEVICGKPKKFKWPLLLNDNSSLTNNNCSQIQYYKIFFNRRLDPQERLKFTITTAFTHVLTPYPKEVAQTERQNILFRGNQYGNSAYHTDQQKTQVK
jgi:oligosaccharyltransferase complex subunit alpha (ribophorin I)